jgi:hypothetical protein
VIEIHAEEGVTVRTNGAYIQGIFGVGGEAWGEIAIVSAGPDRLLEARDLRAEHRGKVVVGGSGTTLAAVEAARELGVAAIIAGGFDKGDLKTLLGFELGVAITGNEDIGITLITTEGFGVIPMTQRTWELLSDLAGQRVSVNGATQIRAGVIRPEIVVPLPDRPVIEEARQTGALELGSEVRIIRQPWFGQRGRVSALPPEPTVIESGARVRVLEVETTAGERVVLPRANIELIEK